MLYYLSYQQLIAEHYIVCWICNLTAGYQYFGATYCLVLQLGELSWQKKRVGGWVIEGRTDLSEPGTGLLVREGAPAQFNLTYLYPEDGGRKSAENCHITLRDMTTIYTYI
jgi:hypothetical protein